MGFPQEQPGGGSAPNLSYITGADETGTFSNSLRLGTKVILAPDILANRPAANTVPQGALFNATDNGTIYRSDGVATWTALTISQVGALLAANNLSDLTNVGTARTNLGLGSLALQNSPLDIPHGGTGQITAQAAFDALSPLTTTGDLLTFLAGHNSRLAIGNSWQELGISAGSPAWLGRTRNLLTADQQTLVSSIAGSASLLNSPFPTILSLNELATTDAIRITLAAILANNSGSASTMSVAVVIKASGAQGTLTVTQAISVASVGTVRNIYMDAVLTVRTLTAGSVLIMDGSQWNNFSATAANQVVVANTTAGTISAVGCPNGGANGPYTLDVQVSSTINNATTTGQLVSLDVTKISV